MSLPYILVRANASLPLGTLPAVKVEAARARRWWLTKRRIGSIERAGAFVEDVGFAVLFPKAGVAFPSLWEVSTDLAVSEISESWGPEAERIWRWKDELPLRGLAWYGHFVRGRASFLSPALLRNLYPRRGAAGDFEDADLSRDAWRIARMLLRSGPQPTSAIREAFGVQDRAGGGSVARAVIELERALVVTHLGIEEAGSGWPSAILELTARAFSIPRRRDADRAALAVARTFLETMLIVRPHELGNAFGWGAERSRQALEELVRRGEAVRDPPSYVLPAVVRA